jgi:FkbM family methyltransferase
VYWKATIKRLLKVSWINRVITSTARAIGLGRYDAIVSRVSRNGVLTIPAFQVSVKLLGGEQIASLLWWRGWNGFEPATAFVIQEIASRARTVLDIGAHVGWYGLLAKQVNPKVDVWAFEPNPPVLQRLRENIALNGVMVHVVAAAASDVNGTAIFYEGAPGLSSSSGLRPEVGGMHSFRVSTVTIDSIVAANNIENIDLVKIDVEGHEPAVLRGMQNVLETMRPYIIFEVGQMVDNVLESGTILARYGYSFRCLDTGEDHDLPVKPRDRSYVNYLASPL